MTMNRRSFIKLVGASTGAGLAGTPYISTASGMMPKPRRVVVIGGGYGGTIVAKYIRMNDPSIEVVLVDRDKTFVSCPFSNLVIAGLRDHRLVLAAGIDFSVEEIEGYDPVETPKVIPHAWKAGEQTLLLRKQLEDMKDGGTVVLSIPVTPFRCPPGPYERISMIAWYLKNHKPKSKIIALDANPDFVSKGKLFRKAWAKHYEGMIEYRPDHKVVKVSNKNRSVDTGVEEIRGDVVNLVPPQKAGLIANKAGVVGDPSKKWCPVNQLTFESTLVKDVHIIGDACVAGALPKSGYSANSEAKVCATNIVQLMNGKDLIDPSHANVCYSYVSAKEAVTVAGVYKVAEGKTIAVPNSGGVSPDLSEQEAIYARSCIKNILTEMSS